MNETEFKITLRKPLVCLTMEMQRHLPMGQTHIMLGTRELALLQAVAQPMEDAIGQTIQGVTKEVTMTTEANREYLV